MPWLYMSAFFEKYKDEYIDNLFRVSTQRRLGSLDRVLFKGNGKANAGMRYLDVSY